MVFHYVMICKTLELKKDYVLFQDFISPTLNQEKLLLLSPSEYL